MSCANAATAPWVLPISNFTFAGKTVSLRRGIPMELGNPPQQLYFLPSVIDDTLAVADREHCTSSDHQPSCIGEHGGLYAFNMSTTWSGVRLELWNGSHTTPNTRDPAAVFNDELRVAGSNLYGFPTVQYDTSIDLPNMLGINEASYFLSIAESSKLAPSRSWGIWVGGYGPGRDVNGSLVIGGYDKARVSGNFTRFNKSASDYLARVYVQSIEYNRPDGGSVQLLQTTRGTTTAIISPENSSFELDSDAFETFVNATGATEYQSLEAWGWPAGTALGNITIRFVNGYETTLPAQDLWQPYTDSGPDASIRVSNDSITISRVMKRNNARNPRYGYPFLASNYLTFHPDENYIELAAVNPDADVQPQIISFCSSTDSGNGKVVNPSAQSSTSAGVIAGAVIGGVAGLALLFALVMLLRWIKRRAKARPKPEPKYTEMPASSSSATMLLRKSDCEQPLVEMPNPVQLAELPATPPSDRD